ncbi:hypothetical protein ACP70R_042496 [Stipagrostis hirtigluma subsp. patula]
MRIRRRPQPSLQVQVSDPSTSPAPQTPQNAARNRECLGPDGGEGEGKLHASSVDLGKKSGAARRLALPQDSAVDCGVSLGAKQEADGVHVSLEANGCHSSDQEDGVTCSSDAGSKSEPEAAKVPEGHVSNGVAPAVAVAVKDQEKVGNGGGGGSGGAKKRRGPMEGSRCSRVNGRGWRCSQPTPAGYSLCEHHLGKGRMRSAAAGARRGAGQLGRTEHRATVPAAAPKAEGPSLPG